LLLLAFVILARIPSYFRKRAEDEAMRRRIDWIHTACAAPHGGWSEPGPEDRKILAELGGDIDTERGLNDAGQLYVHFPPIERDMKAARELRASGALSPSF
jgi:hypothetical protein